MYSVVKIGGKDVPMLSMASVDVYYRNVFHDDPLTLQAHLSEEGEAIAFYERIGFIMAALAERKTREKMRELCEDDFLDWIDQFDRIDLLNALTDIQQVYNGQSVTNAEAKKNNDEPSGK